MNVILQKTKENGSGEMQKLLAYAGSIAKTHDLDFNKDNICFNQEDFTKLINSKKNCVIVFDEARVGMSELGIKIQNKNIELLNLKNLLFIFENETKRTGADLMYLNKKIKILKEKIKAHELGSLTK